MEVATACIEHPRRVESPLLKVIVRYAVERDANAPRKREERNALAKTLSTLLLTGDASGAADGAPLALKPHLGVMVLKGIDYTEPVTSVGTDGVDVHTFCKVRVPAPAEPLNGAASAADGADADDAAVADAREGERLARRCRKPRAPLLRASPRQLRQLWRCVTARDRPSTSRAGGGSSAPDVKSG
ncbi:hypothetical protein KFE25_006837 [Diacronema lutheri]|uniref:Uncharacterized protein n=1 Tax=Diacronema lutheri TaxID=2081491 RepID=A0A8J5XYG2_DIALT|nr:hypothetical protein KFE25_006837 [Diacronema lutheri]